MCLFALAECFLVIRGVWEEKLMQTGNNHEKVIESVVGFQTLVNSTVSRFCLRAGQRSQS